MIDASICGTLSVHSGLVGGPVLIGLILILVEPVLMVTGGAVTTLCDWLAANHCAQA